MKVESADTEEQIVNDAEKEDKVVKEAKEVIASSQLKTISPVLEGSMLDKPIAAELQTMM